MNTSMEALRSKEFAAVASVAALIGGQAEVASGGGLASQAEADQHSLNDARRGVAIRSVGSLGLEGAQSQDRVSKNNERFTFKKGYIGVIIAYSHNSSRASDDQEYPIGDRGLDAMSQQDLKIVMTNKGIKANATCPEKRDPYFVKSVNLSLGQEPKTNNVDGCYSRDYEYVVNPDADVQTEKDEIGNWAARTAKVATRKIGNVKKVIIKPKNILKDKGKVIIKYAGSKLQKVTYKDKKLVSVKNRKT